MASCHVVVATVDLDAMAVNHSTIVLSPRTEQLMYSGNIIVNTHVSVGSIANTSAINHVPPSTSALRYVNSLVDKSVPMLAVTSTAPLRVLPVKNHVLGMRRGVSLPSYCSNYFQRNCIHYTCPVPCGSVCNPVLTKAFADSTSTFRFAQDYPVTFAATIFCNVDISVLPVSDMSLVHIVTRY